MLHVEKMYHYKTMSLVQIINMPIFDDIDKVYLKNLHFCYVEVTILDQVALNTIRAVFF